MISNFDNRFLMQKAGAKQNGFVSGKTGARGPFSTSHSNAARSRDSSLMDNDDDDNPPDSPNG
jgi:hypothetical protein